MDLDSLFIVQILQGDFNMFLYFGFHVRIFNRYTLVAQSKVPSIEQHYIFLVVIVFLHRGLEKNMPFLGSTSKRQLYRGVVLPKISTKSRIRQSTLNPKR